VRKHFTPEFINRIDEFIIFEPLAKTHIRKIVRLRLKGVEARIADKKMKLQVGGWKEMARGSRLGVAGPVRC
jgi:ATP-dependent Clp protease ATP-binding subunit ClpB